MHSLSRTSFHAMSAFKEKDRIYQAQLIATSAAERQARAARLAGASVAVHAASVPAPARRVAPTESPAPAIKVETIIKTESVGPVPVAPPAAVPVTPPAAVPVTLPAAPRAATPAAVPAATSTTARAATPSASALVPSHSLYRAEELNARIAVLDGLAARFMPAETGAMGGLSSHHLYTHIKRDRNGEYA